MAFIMNGLSKIILLKIQVVIKKQSPFEEI